MATPNMATIAASLERSLRNCSLNTQHAGEDEEDEDEEEEEEEDSTGLELNSQGALPFHWEQCLDLKTGEIYYINWRTGMRVKEDPRTSAPAEESSDDDTTSYGSQDSTSESSLSSSREQWSGGNNNNNNNNNQNPEIINYYYSEKEGKEKNNSSSNSSVLVVAGCKRCLMYYMVPKQLQICPKCCGHLLHFDRSGNGNGCSSSSS